MLNVSIQAMIQDKICSAVIGRAVPRTSREQHETQAARRTPHCTRFVRYLVLLSGGRGGREERQGEAGCVQCPSIYPAHTRPNTAKTITNPYQQQKSPKPFGHFFFINFDNFFCLPLLVFVDSAL